MSSAKILMFGLVVLGMSGCVGKKRYEAALAETYQLQDRQSELEAEKERLQERLDVASGVNIDQKRLLDEAYRKLAQSSAEAGALKSDVVRMQGDVERMEQAIEEMGKREERAREALESFQDLVRRFKSLIDAGTLRVKVVDGLMIVELATDILFSPGKAALSKEGQQAIGDVAAVLQDIEGRQVQVAGHTDNVPIKNSRFPTNWHLGASRAIAVTEVLVRSGLDAERVSASSYADTRPADTNRTKEGRARNRRIEMILVPDLSLLPGFEELKDFAGSQ
jgi:chemotaxis protein MotB